MGGDDWMAEADAERLAEIERDEARSSTPAAIAAREAKKRAEFERGLRLGWWDADGNSLVPEDDAEDEEEDQE